MAAAAKSKKLGVKASSNDVDVELAEVYADANESTSQDEVLIKVKAEDQELINQFYASFDYVMVFPMMGEGQIPFNPKDPTSSEQSTMAKYVINTMLQAHFKIHTFLSVQSDELFVLFSMEDDRLLAFADQTNYQLELDGNYCRNELARGLEKHRIKPIKIADELRFSYMHPFDHLHGRYSRTADQSIYKQYPGKISLFESKCSIKAQGAGAGAAEENKSQKGSWQKPLHDDTCEGKTSILSQTDRLKLTYLMLLASKRQGGCKLDIQGYLVKKDLLTLYPMHNTTEKEALLKEVWTKFRMPWNMPYEPIRQYMGEKIAIFFVFIGHQSKWLIAPGIVGFIVQIVVWSTGPNFSHPVLPFFGLFTVFWAILWLNNWKREECTKAMEWGMTGFEETEINRPQFRGDIITSPITGQFELWYPPDVRRRKNLFSQACICALILAACGVTSSVYVMRSALEPSLKENAATVASFISGIQIALFNIAFTSVAGRLNDGENHQTDTGYEDSLISKVFSFQFVNSYISFFYLAFIAQYLERSQYDEGEFLGQCGYYNCMQPLAIQLAAIYGSRLTSNNVIEIAMDWYYYRAKFNAETKGTAKGIENLSPPELEYALLEANVIYDSINLFVDTAIQFGYSVLFIVALPAAFLATLGSNYLKVRLTANKMTSWYQRSIPSGVEDIGAWQAIFYFIAYVGVLTNAALICFTMDTLKFEIETLDHLTPESLRPLPFKRGNFSSTERGWIFFGFVLFCSLGMATITYFIPNEPEEVHLQNQRKAFIISKIIDHVEDEDFDDDDEDQILAEAAEEEDGLTGGSSRRGGCSMFCPEDKTQTKKNHKVPVFDEFPILGVPFSANDIKAPLNESDVKAAKKKKKK